MVSNGVMFGDGKFFGTVNARAVDVCVYCLMMERRKGAKSIKETLQLRHIIMKWLARAPLPQSLSPSLMSCLYMRSKWVVLILK